MKRITIFSSIAAAVLFVGFAVGPPERPYPSSVPEIDKRVEDLLRRMTLEEKVGQMTQLTIDVVSAGEDGRREPHALDGEKLATALKQWHVGSIINVGPSFYSLDHWDEVITRIQDVAVKETRLGIPVLYGIDAIHGANYTEGATMFPQPLAMASAWNTEVARRIGEVTSTEVRASGIPWNFFPVMDLGRQPLWSRLWETMGEDVHLASTVGEAYIRGAMGNDVSQRDKLALCLKHYVGYSAPLSGKDRTPAWIDERMMREYYLPTFETGIRAGVPTVMVNSAEVNGIPGHANYELLTGILKDEWKFNGFVVSDWEDIKRLHTRDRVAESHKEAVRMAVMAGVDMSMVPHDYSFAEHLLALVREGSVPMTRIDDAVRRILRVKVMLGLFERPYPDRTLRGRFAGEDHTRLNRRAAQESLVLLKNDGGTLPLKKGARVLVTGPTANMLSPLNGGWTITWQGDREDLYPKDKKTILQAIREKIGGPNVMFQPGSGFSGPSDIAAAVEAARSSDVVVACLGEPAYCETPGNIDDLTLDDAQLRLVEALAATGKPVVLVLIQGRPRIIRRIEPIASAILLGFLPGMEGGPAVADVLFGDVNPGGKLPVTYPKYPNALVPYDHKPMEQADGNRYDPQYPFGHGLSYTTFRYGSLSLSRDRVRLNDSVTVSVSVTNTGKRAGSEVVQLYVTDRFRSITPPVRQLKAFRKVELQPGETRSVSFALRPSDLSFVGHDNRRVVERGEFIVSVDTLRATFTLMESSLSGTR